MYVNNNIQILMKSSYIAIVRLQIVIGRDHIAIVGWAYALLST